MNIVDFWTQVVQRSAKDERIGQAMFNVLPTDLPGMAELAGSLDDPFYRIKNWVSARTWAAKHLRLNDNNDITEVVI